MGRGTQIAYSLIREEVPFIARDELLYPYIQRVQRLVREGILVKEVLEGIGRKR